MDLRHQDDTNTDTLALSFGAKGGLMHGVVSPQEYIYLGFESFDPDSPLVGTTVLYEGAENKHKLYRRKVRECPREGDK